MCMYMYVYIYIYTYMHTRLVLFYDHISSLCCMFMIRLCVCDLYVVCLVCLFHVLVSYGLCVCLYVLIYRIRYMLCDWLTRPRRPLSQIVDASISKLCNCYVYIYIYIYIYI